MTTKRTYLAAVSLLGFTATVVLLFCYAPDQYSFYPRCLFHSLTGLQCPGCGGLRATHYLLHGDIAAAFHLNQLFVLLLPFLLLFGAVRLVKTVLEKTAQSEGGISGLSAEPNCQQDRPPLLPPLRRAHGAGKPREEREDGPLLFFANSIAAWQPFFLWALLVVAVLFTILRNL